MVEDSRRFELVEVVGSGGFGTVYRALFVGEGGFEKMVALKVLNQKLEDVEEVARRLRDEARMLGLIRHRAVVQVDRLMKLDGRWTIVMEYVEGRSIAQILRHGVVPPAAAIEIVGEIAGALNTAYNCVGPKGAPLRLLHRDIKPSNIQITPHGEVKVLDFGIARAEFGAREAETRSLAFGTLEYMSPERLDMQEDGPQADVYAAGVLLYEMLTGSNFGRTSARKDRHEAKIQDAMAQLDGVEGLSAGLIEMLHAMLAWSPDDRPSASEVERRCVKLRLGLSSEPLRFWTERVVIALMAQARTSADEDRSLDGDLVGTILMERSQGRTPGGQEARWEKATPEGGQNQPGDPSPSPSSAVTRETPAPVLVLAQLDDSAELSAPLLAQIPEEPHVLEEPPDGSEDSRSEAPLRRPQYLRLGLLMGLVLGVVVVVAGGASSSGEPAVRPVDAATDPRAAAQLPQEQSTVVAPPEARLEPTTPSPGEAPALPKASSQKTSSPRASSPKTSSSGATQATAAAPVPVTTTAKSTPKASNPSAVRVPVTLKGNFDTIEVQMTGQGHRYEFSGVEQVEVGSYGVQVRESPWASWIEVNPVTITAEGHSKGLTLRCHTAQRLCKVVTP